MHLGGRRRWVPLFMVRCENVDTPTMTSITISQEEIEEKICKLKTEESYGVRWRIYVGPRTHVILALHKRPPKITTLCGNLSVGRQHNNILYRRNDGFANKQCSS